MELRILCFILKFKNLKIVLAIIINTFLSICFQLYENDIITHKWPSPYKLRLITQNLSHRKNYVELRKILGNQYSVQNEIDHLILGIYIIPINVNDQEMAELRPKRIVGAH